MLFKVYCQTLTNFLETSNPIAHALPPVPDPWRDSGCQPPAFMVSYVSLTNYSFNLLQQVSRISFRIHSEGSLISAFLNLLQQVSRTSFRIHSEGSSQFIRKTLKEQLL